MSQVRANRLCPGFLCLKIQIPKTKFQTVRLAHRPEPSRRANLKFQCSMINTFDNAFFGFFDFGHLKFFDIWNLMIGISIS